MKSSGECHVNSFISILRFSAPVFFVTTFLVMALNAEMGNILYVAISSQFVTRQFDCRMSNGIVLCRLKMMGRRKLRTKTSTWEIRYVPDLAIYLQIHT